MCAQKQSRRRPGEFVCAGSTLERANVSVPGFPYSLVHAAVGVF